ncbi:hypothetical protein GDO86_011291 [Hymenochirus boettgeri]|uniref:Serpin domain-containing protein n=1 Tax=Hymenochirus boettgeri TaxID=247094 RepID=A0A8T2JFW0_9PIPI|nr:hypothetical protein GDO86_011291 [Hymenochirus boettgeri]
MSSLSQSISGFSLELFKTLEKDAKTSNVSYSPFSITTALSMVLLGARGETAAQMEKTSQDEAIHQAFKELLSTLNKPNQAYELSVANRLYGDKNFTFSKDYILGTEKFYNATLESVDFKHNAEAARVKINLWVESQTKEEGTWMKKFNKDNTKDAPFFLNKLETKMTSEKFAKLLNSENMQITEVLLHVPQFKLEQTYNLEDVLASMGITKLFKNADLSGMAKGADLQVSKVIHKCFIEVNEEGTVAAAATGITVVTTSLPLNPPEEFKVDHPFLFFIKHDATNSLLFFGKVISP